MKPKILFPTDFSPASTYALRYILQYADSKKATIDLLHVLPYDYQGYEAGAVLVEATKTNLLYAQKRVRRQLEEAQALIETNKVLDKLPDINIKVEYGYPKDTIAQLTKAGQYDLLAIGTRGESGRLMGSFTSAVVEKSQCNILVIPENCMYKDIRTIVYATEYQKADPYCIFEMLETLYCDSPKVHYLHVIQKKQPTQNKARLNQFYKRHMPFVMLDDVEPHDDSIESTIKYFAKKKEANLIAMVSPKHNVLHQIFFKSHTKKMTGTTELPLLVLKD